MANQVFTLDRLVYSDGRPTKYCVPGRKPDTMQTLEADAFIEWRGDAILVMQPNDPRVVAWQVGVNEYLRAVGDRPPSTKCPNPSLTQLVSRTARRKASAPKDEKVSNNLLKQIQQAALDRRGR